VATILDVVKIEQVTLPIAIGLIWMMYVARKVSVIWFDKDGLPIHRRINATVTRIPN
jgi:hypothetical protein